MSRPQPHYLRGAPQLTREGFVRILRERYKLSPAALRRIEATIVPCKCGNPPCRGWRADQRVIVRELNR